MDFQTWITFYSNSVVNLNTFLFEIKGFRDDDTVR